MTTGIIRHGCKPQLCESLNRGLPKQALPKQIPGDREVGVQ